MTKRNETAEPHNVGFGIDAPLPILNYPKLPYMCYPLWNIPVHVLPFVEYFHACVTLCGIFPCMCYPLWNISVHVLPFVEYFRTCVTLCGIFPRFEPLSFSEDISPFSDAVQLTV